MTFGYVIPLALGLASCNTDVIVNSTTGFVAQDNQNDM